MAHRTRLCPIRMTGREYGAAEREEMELKKFRKLSFLNLLNLLNLSNERHPPLHHLHLAVGKFDLDEIDVDTHIH